MVAKSLSDCSNELMLLTARIDSLLSDRSLTPEDNPLSPKVLGKAFVDACDNLDIDIKSKLMLFKLFDKQVFGKLAAFYQHSNQQLEDDGVLPNLALADAHRAISANAPMPSESSLHEPSSDNVSLDNMAVFDPRDDAEKPAAGSAEDPDVFRTMQQLMTQLQRFNTTDTQAKLAPRARAVSRDQVVRALSEIQGQSAQLPVDKFLSSKIKPKRSSTRLIASSSSWPIRRLWPPLASVNCLISCSLANFKSPWLGATET